MEPFLRDGGHVLTFNWGKVKVGDVIVFVLPYRHPGVATTTIGSIDSIASLQNDKIIYFVKRVKKISGARVTVEGDNKKMSSRIGPIDKGKIVGKVVLKY